jgi:hypothetical protein
MKQISPSRQPVGLRVKSCEEVGLTFTGSESFVSCLSVARWSAAAADDAN